MGIVASATNSSLIDHYNADVVSAQDYYPFGMLMPGRKWDNGNKYRYGMHGKMKDDDVKGEGNQIDYGMRVYDTRAGRFLSVDPLAKKYAWYSPYQFAGNSPIVNIYADGGEPRSFIKDWIPKPMYDLRSGKRLEENNGFGKTVSDPSLGFVDVELVYDTWTRQSWFIHQGNDGQFYYLKNENNKTDELVLKSGTIRVKAGSFEPFNTQDQIQSRLSKDVTDNMQKAVFMSAAIIAFAPAAETLGGESLLAINDPLSKIGLIKAAVGSGSDYLAQKTLDPDGKTNVYSLVANGILANPFTAGAAASIRGIDKEKDEYEFSSLESFAAGSMLNGTFGALGGKLMKPFAPRVNLSANTNTVYAISNTMVSFWSNTAASAATNAATEPKKDDNNANSQNP